MSTTVTKGAAAAAPAAQPKASIPAVSLLNNAASVPAAIIHPVVLAGLFVWRFDALVADPVSTLQFSLPVVAVVQAAFAMLCFPPAGSQAAKAAKKQKKDAIVPNSIATAIISLLLTALTIPFFYILFVLFGAPFLTHALDTFLCCAHFAVLAVFPIFFVRGSDTKALQAVLGVAAPLDQSFGGLAGATIGAWLGAVPIPLDWDREWQKWPVTIVVGIYLGYIVGSKFLGTVFHGTRWAEESGPKED